MQYNTTFNYDLHHKQNWVQISNNVNKNWTLCVCFVLK